MYLIAGLGNPEPKYDGTRHNAGFAAMDALCRQVSASLTEHRFAGLFGTAYLHGEKLLLLKPLTYMNLSGKAVREAAFFYKLPVDHVIILSDDVNLACGRLRVRGKGSAGGHNGLKNIISELSDDGFLRVRIGVGGLQPEEDLVSHVLGHFSAEDAKVMERAYEAAAQAALSLVENGVPETMNRYNGLDLAAEGSCTTR